MTKFSPEALNPSYRLKYPGENPETILIKPTANAWWSDPNRVHEFLTAIGIGATITEACVYVGITLKQYKYFVQLHPEFIDLKNAYSVILVLKARQTIAQGITRNYKNAMKYLEKKRPEEFGKIRAKSPKKDYGPLLTKQQEETLMRIAKGGN